MKFNKRTTAIAVTAMFLVGGASAGVIDYFAESTGSGSVNEAISVNGNNGIDFSTQDGTAPETYQERLALTNNNPDDVVDYTWALTGDNGESYINSGVYQVSEHRLYKSSYGASYSSIDDATVSDYNVTVIPSYDTVTYSVDIPSDADSAGYVNVELTRKSGEKFHIGYDGSIYYKNPSETGSKKTDVQNFEPYVSHDIDSDTFNLTVERAPGFSQSFAVHAGTDSLSSNDYLITRNALEDDISKGAVGDDKGGVYYGSASEAHQTPTVTDLVGQELDHEGGTSEDYNFAVEFTEQTGSGSYTVTAQAEP